IDPSKDEEIEPLSGPRIDLGEIFAEELGLALEPYPHAPGAYALAARDLGPHAGLGASGPVDTPFAALRELKEKRAG
ncbi:MAG: YceD family protein, partial [Geminicoccales bacterium]